MRQAPHWKYSQCSVRTLALSLTLTLGLPTAASAQQAGVLLRPEDKRGASIYGTAEEQSWLQQLSSKVKSWWKPAESQPASLLPPQALPAPPEDQTAELRRGATIPQPEGLAGLSLGTETWNKLSQSNPIPASTSFSASTGLINIPSANIVGEGIALLHRDNHIDKRFIDRTGSGHTTAFVISPVPNVEVSGRLSNYTLAGAPPPAPFGFDPLVIRDLSANFKFQLPLAHEGSWLPNLAIGATDVGGAASFFKSQYGVATWHLGALQATLGYGRAQQQFNGAFGGLQLDLFNTGLSLLLEDDARNQWAGMRYTSAPIRMMGATRLVGTVARSINGINNAGQPADRTEMSVAVQIPIAEKSSATSLPSLRQVAMESLQAVGLMGSSVKPATQALDQTTGNWPTQDATSSLLNREQKVSLAELRQEAYTQAASTEAGKSLDDALIQRVADKLAQLGLDRVRVGITGSQNDVLVAEFENYQYSRNDLDAIGVALGTLAEHTSGYSAKDLIVVSKKAGQAIFSVLAERNRYAAYLGGDSGSALTDHLRVTPANMVEEDQVRWHGTPTEGTRVRITIGPRVSARYGTEVGTLDYSSGYGVNVAVPLWRGGELYATYKDEVYHTANFRPGGLFQNELLESGLEALTLNQSWWLGKRMLNVSSYGRMFDTQKGFQHESNYFLPWNGDLVRARLTRTETTEAPGIGRPKVHSDQVGYRHHLHSLNAFVEWNYNNYLTGDHGYSLDFRRYFSDFSITGTIRNSNVVRFAGITFGFPLTPRKTWPRWNGIMVSGEPEFGLSVLSKVGGTDNSLAEVGSVLTGYNYNTNLLLINRGRISEGYFMQNLGRLREAYFRYAKGQE